MSSPESFEDLDAWKLARELTNEIYGFCRRDPLCRDFGLADQIRRAAVSVMNNIAEGFGSVSDADFASFLNFARRSVFEVVNMLVLLKRDGYLGEADVSGLLSELEEQSKMILAFHRRLKP